MNDKPAQAPPEDENKQIRDEIHDAIHILKKAIDKKEEDSALNILSTLQSILKWGFAYLTGVLIVTGYIVRYAQQQLLGIRQLEFETHSYIESAVSFLTTIISFLLQSVMSNKVISIVTLCCALLIMIVIRTSPNGEGPSWYRDVMARISNRLRIGLLVYLLTFFSLISLTMYELVNIDLPLTMINHVLTKPPHEVTALEEPIMLRTAADAIWNTYTCSKAINTSFLSADNSMEEEGIKCKDDLVSARKNINKLFMGRLVVAMVICVTGIFFMTLLVGNSIEKGMVAALIIYHLLMLPYVYGKIIPSAKYPFAEVTIKGSLYPKPYLKNDVSVSHGTARFNAYLISVDKESITFRQEVKSSRCNGQASEWKQFTIDMRGIISYHVLTDKDILKDYLESQLCLGA